MCKKVLGSWGMKQRMFLSAAGRRDFKFEASSFMVPHPEKASKGGEDAVCVSKTGKLIGVADGVGGWAEVGVDPSEYSRSLMKHSLMAYEERDIHEPLQIMKFAHQNVNPFFPLLLDRDTETIKD